MNFVQILYHLMVLWLLIHFIWYLFQEQKFWNKLNAVIVLVMFLLRVILWK